VSGKHVITMRVKVSQRNCTVKRTTVVSGRHGITMRVKVGQRKCTVKRTTIVSSWPKKLDSQEDYSCVRKARYHHEGESWPSASLGHSPSLLPSCSIASIRDSSFQPRRPGQPAAPLQTLRASPALFSLKPPPTLDIMLLVKYLHYHQ